MGDVRGLTIQPMTQCRVPTGSGVGTLLLCTSLTDLVLIDPTGSI